MSRATEEERLIRRAVAGDREALSALLEVHAPAVGATLDIPKTWQSLLSVEDVLQDTFIEAFLHIREFVPREDGSFCGWLCRIASRNCVDVIRALKTEKRGGGRRRLPLEGPGSSLFELTVLLGITHSTPRQAASFGEACEALKTALATLPDQYRRVVELYDLEGVPMGEVAAQLKRSVGSTHMLRIRAHRMLRDKLGTMTRFVSPGS